MLVSGSLGACASPVTQLVVVVESDRSIPDELDKVLVRTERDGRELDSHTFEVEVAPDMPFSFGIAPAADNPTLSLTIVVEGWSSRGRVVSRTIDTEFIRDETRLLRVRLDRCSAAACETRERIAGDQLPQVEPGRELEYDGGQVDSGGDSDSGAMPELDAGPPQVDAGSDGGLPNDDAGVRSDGGPTTMPASCAEHLARAGMPLPDGVYVIDPDGAGAVEPIQVFCEMQDDGGGWTLLLKADGFDAPPGGASQLGFDSAYWTGSARLRPTSLSRDREEAVLDAYHSVGVRELRIEMWETPGRSASAVLGTLGGDSLGATIRAGVSVPLGDRATWEPVVGQSLPSAACLESGINVRMAGAVFVRVGAVASGNASCAPAVGWMGIGARVSAQSGCDASTNSAGGARLCGPPGQRRTWQRFALVFGR